MKLDTAKLWHTRMHHKPLDMKIQVKHDLSLHSFYSQGLPNIENTVQKHIGKIVKVPKNSNMILLMCNNV